MLGRMFLPRWRERDADTPWADHTPKASYLSNPDGVDLAPPYSLTMLYAHTLRAP
jgi:hypothetical protein